MMMMMMMMMLVLYCTHNCEFQHYVYAMLHLNHYILYRVLEAIVFSLCHVNLYVLLLHTVHILPLFYSACQVVISVS